MVNGRFVGMPVPPAPVGIVNGRVMPDGKEKPGGRPVGAAVLLELVAGIVGIVNGRESPDGRAVGGAVGIVNGRVRPDGREKPGGRPVGAAVLLELDVGGIEGSVNGSESPDGRAVGGAVGIVNGRVRPDGRENLGGRPVGAAVLLELDVGGIEGSVNGRESPDGSAVGAAVGIVKGRETLAGTENPGGRPVDAAVLLEVGKSGSVLDAGGKVTPDGRENGKDTLDGSCLFS